jgi:restriction system protein
LPLEGWRRLAPPASLRRNFFAAGDDQFNKKRCWMTIVEAIKQVMHEAARPLTAREAFTAIVDKSLYEFHAMDPLHVVSMQIRRHCAGLDFPSAVPNKHFQQNGDGRYSPLPQVLRSKRAAKRRVPREGAAEAPECDGGGELSDVEEQLWTLHAKYQKLFVEHMLRELKLLSPEDFEAFARDLLQAYGFKDTEVTSFSRDGGIDGHGKLKVGLADLKVAFQCKRWTKGNIQRTEIDKFRGACQGNFEQGIFFTTSSFAKGAIAVTTRPGAITVVMVDGPQIVKMMVDKKFRVESSVMEIPAFAL